MVVIFWRRENVPLFLKDVPYFPYTKAHRIFYGQELTERVSINSSKVHVLSTLPSLPI